MPQAFAELAALYTEDGDDPNARFVSLSAALRGEADEPYMIIPYLATLGLHPTTLEQLSLAITGIPDEDEIACWDVVEGVAVSIASDAAWVVFTP